MAKRSVLTLSRVQPLRGSGASSSLGKRSQAYAELLDLPHEGNQFGEIAPEPIKSGNDEYVNSSRS
jgi:hypothetical protein